MTRARSSRVTVRGIDLRRLVRRQRDLDASVRGRRDQRRAGPAAGRGGATAPALRRGGRDGRLPMEQRAGRVASRAASAAAASR